MDRDYLLKLVHPVTKNPLSPDASGNYLSAAGDPGQFAVRDGIPILLVEELDAALTDTPLHRQEGTGFKYKEHYETDAVHYNYFEAPENPVEREEIRRLHEAILNELPKEAEWVLDVGCGGGWLSKTLAPAGIHIISMDISTLNPKKALGQTPLPHHYGLVADVFDLPIAPGSMDAIVASEIMEHVPDPKAFIASLTAALKPGGKLIITTPYNEKISYSLCVHCNHLTPHNAHLHSFTEEKVQALSPVSGVRMQTGIYSNKLLVRTRLQYLLRFLPYRIYKGIDDLANGLSGKKAYRLFTIIRKL